MGKEIPAALVTKLESGVKMSNPAIIGIRLEARSLTCFPSLPVSINLILLKNIAFPKIKKAMISNSYKVCK